MIRGAATRPRNSGWSPKTASFHPSSKHHEGTTALSGHPWRQQRLHFALWGIESVHYVRDVTFGEDASTVRTGHAPQNLAALRNLVIGLCALEGIRQDKRASYLPRFRNAANNDRQVAIDLIRSPLLNGS
jgi:hypothetical protein